MKKGSGTSKRMVETWIGLVILVIVAGFAYWAIQYYAPKADSGDGQCSVQGLSSLFQPERAQAIGSVQGLICANVTAYESRTGKQIGSSKAPILVPQTIAMFVTGATGATDSCSNTNGYPTPNAYHPNVYLKGGNTYRADIGVGVGPSPIYYCLGTAGGNILQDSSYQQYSCDAKATPVTLTYANPAKWVNLKLQCKKI